MALTRAMLKGMGLTEEQVSAIIEEHTNVTTSFKDQIKTYKADAEKLPEVQKELDTLKAEMQKDNPFEKKYTDLKNEYDKFKSDVTEEKNKVARMSAAKAYFESKNITGSNLDLALRAAKEEIDAAELENGKIKDISVFDGLIEGALAGLVTKTKEQGANISNPPNGTGGVSFKDMPLAEKMQYANEHPDDAEVKTWLE